MKDLTPTTKTDKIKRSTKLYDLYVDGNKVATSLFWSELIEIMKEYRKQYSEMGHKPKFEHKEV